MDNRIKLTIIGLGLLALASCAAPVNKVSFGKKCHTVADTKESGVTRTTTSYVWFYDSKSGLPATADQCPPKEKKQ
jgi:hypothetical protein